jgi:hypothetical protein
MRQIIKSNSFALKITNCLYFCLSLRIFTKIMQRSMQRFVFNRHCKAIGEWNDNPMALTLMGTYRCIFYCFGLINLRYLSVNTTGSLSPPAP